MPTQRVFISLPRDTWESIKELAESNRRLPRHEIEFLVIEAARERQPHRETEPALVQQDHD